MSGLKSKKTISSTGVGAAVIASVVVTFGLDSEERDFVNGEVKWLFGALDNTLKIQRGDVQRDHPIPTPIPDDAEREASADNKLFSQVEEFELGLWAKQIESGLKRIRIHLKNLNILLEQEVMKGPAGKGDVYLQNQIQSGRLEIVKVMQEMAQIMSQAYGIMITSPDQLLELLE